MTPLALLLTIGCPSAPPPQQPQPQPQEPPCTVGQAQSGATADSLDLFGEIAYYADGTELPKGRYRVTYVDGCMKYDSGSGWATHSGVEGVGFFLGTATGDKLLKPPGTVGHRMGRGGFEDFEACVEANRKTEPLEFDFAGGKLGIWLYDRPYRDNIAGLAGRNPAWRLDRVSGCAPGGTSD